MLATQKTVYVSPQGGTPFHREMVRNQAAMYKRFMARMVAKSERFAQTTKFESYVEIENVHGEVRTQPARFPDVIAAYNQTSADLYDDITDARFYVKRPEVVMTEKQHLPHYSTIEQVAKDFKSKNSTRDRKPWATQHPRLCLRGDVPIQKPAMICMDAEVVKPIVLNSKEKYRFVVKGALGTNNEAYASDWLQAQDFVASTAYNMSVRRRNLDELEDEIARVSGAQIDVPGVHQASLTNQIVMMYHPKGADPKKYHFKNYKGDGNMEGVLANTRHDDECKLMDFSVCWADNAHGEKRLAVCAYTVNFNFLKPRAAGATADSEPELCVICSDEVTADDPGSSDSDDEEGEIRRNGRYSINRCHHCQVPVHAECLVTWRRECRNMELEPACLMCRNPV